MYHWINRLTKQSRGAERFRSGILRMPRVLVFLLVTMLGWCIYVFARRTRQTVIHNMGELMPLLSASAIRMMCRQYFIHESLTVYEQTIEYRRALTRQGKNRAEFHFQGLEHLDEALRLGRGAIVYTPHIGNYFYFYWMLSQKYNCTTVCTAGSDELRMLFVGLHQLGLKGHDYDNEPPLELVQSLRAHLKQNGVVFMLGDFWRKEFPDCTLFGKPSNAPAGTMTLALLQKVPIVPLYGRREGWFHHHMVLEPPVYLYEQFSMDRKAEAMDELARLMERMISRAPQQWLYWFNVHERWQTAVSMRSEEAGEI